MNSNNKTPLEYYERAIQELINTREQLETELESLKVLKDELKFTKDELATTQAKLDDTQRELSNTKQELQQKTEFFEEFNRKNEAQLNYCYSEIKNLKNLIGSQTTESFEKFSKKMEAQVNYCYSETQNLKNQINSLTSDIFAGCLSLNYRKLKYFLENKMWKEADEETFKKLLELTGREKEGTLLETDLNLLLSEDLRTIDQLWIKYSNGNFGLSIQTKIYHSLKNTQQQKDDQVWNAFGEKVGWYVNNSWLWYKSVNFSTSAPSGHLPARIWDNWDKGGVGSFKPLLSRLIDCGI
ncbi:MAG: GUN4 domain-containing protein [Lyngbya sp.]|nr:GUN4 domain-containing protein [Lyngbya sp.]